MPIDETPVRDNRNRDAILSENRPVFAVIRIQEQNFLGIIDLKDILYYG